MSRARHEEEKKKREEEHEREEHAAGGHVEPEVKPKPYNAEGSEALKEAEEKKRGGRMKKKRGGHVPGEEKRHRLDRPKHKSGGRIGSDKSPLTSAAHVRDAEDHKATEGNAEEGP
jgi:hypothetical protein